jgi:hypothetical protein
MANNTDAWLKRAREVLAKGRMTNESVPFAPSILAAHYGARSPQLEVRSESETQLTLVKQVKSARVTIRQTHPLAR